MAELRWTSVDVTAQVSNEGFCRGSHTKSIIHASSGVIRPGQILAVIGPSGAGKTTLFNVLSKRDNDYDVYGDLRLNGARYDSDHLKMISGFVWQESLYLSHLTPREALLFNARLKLPKVVSKAEREKRVDDLIRAFDLEKCRETFIGDDMLKGISGGEKKRLSIAVEVLSRPKLLFLDEPTSGLDATSAYRVMSLLRLLADSGTTVITTLHQPRPAIARSIDRFLVLSSGFQVFFGPLNDMLGHFDRLGYRCPTDENPLDYMLDLINTERDEDLEDASGGKLASNEMAARLLNIEPRPNAEFQLEPLPSALQPGQTRPQLAARLAALYKETAIAERYMSHEDDDKSLEPIKVTHGGFQSSWFTRLGVVIHREFMQKLRNPQVTVAQLMGAVIMGTIMGSFFYKIPSSNSFLIGNAIAFVATFSLFFSFHLVLFFPKERHVFLRDFSQGIMGTSEYYFGLALTDIPSAILASTLFGTIFYFMVGLTLDPPIRFAVFLGCTILTGCTGSAMLLALGSFAPDPATANTLVTLVFLFVMFLNGYFSDSPVAWAWIETINFLRFMTNALMLNQFEGQVYNCVISASCPYESGDAFLASFGLGSESIGILCLYTVIVWFCFHLVGLFGVSFMYNGRLRNFLKRRDEKKRSKQEADKPHFDIRTGISDDNFTKQSIELISSNEPHDNNKHGHLDL